MPIASSVFPALSCINCKVSGIILRSLIYFELILVQGDKHGSSFSFLHAVSASVEMIKLFLSLLLLMYNVLHL
jgi:hypothetical protein